MPADIWNDYHVMGQRGRGAAFERFQIQAGRYNSLFH